MMSIASDTISKKRHESSSSHELTIVVASSLDELQTHQDAWESLAKSTVVPNIYYEPQLVMPAVKHFGFKGTMRFVFLYDATVDRNMVAFFPLEIGSTLKGIPFKYARLWQYEYCYLCTPLIRRGEERNAVAVLFNYLADRDVACNALKMEHFSADGPFQSALLGELSERKNPFWRSKRFSSVLLKPESSWETYQQKYISKNLRKQVRKCERKLEQHHSFEHTNLSQNDEVHVWIDEFLKLESSGWKQRRGSAMACHHSTIGFFEEAARNAFQKKSLAMSKLALDGKTIAMTCDFLSGRAGFCFKSAFDEQFADYSPGFYLDWCQLRVVHKRGNLNWFDSCSAPNHPVLGRLWNEQQTIESYWCSTGTRRGNLAVSVLPHLKAMTKRTG